MSLELIKIDKTSLPQVVELFDQEKFFFKTKRPEFINESLVAKLVYDSNEMTYGIYYNGLLEGVAAFDKDCIDFESVYLFVRCKDMSLLINNTEDFMSKITSALSGYKYIKFLVYAFDEQGNELCKQLSCEIEAVFKQHIFKFNNYNDVYIYYKKIG